MGDLFQVNTQNENGRYRPSSESDLQLELLRKKVLLSHLIMRNKVLKRKQNHWVQKLLQGSTQPQFANTDDPECNSEDVKPPNGAVISRDADLVIGQGGAPSGANGCVAERQGQQLLDRDGSAAQALGLHPYGHPYQWNHPLQGSTSISRANGQRFGSSQNRTAKIEPATSTKS